MEIFFEKIIIYSSVFLLCLVIVYIYLKKLSKESKIVESKIQLAKKEGTFEPVSLHPVIDLNTCIKSGACIEACPEKDILGIVNGRATLVNASLCVGHGACFHACPVEAISLVIGTEKRGVDLPHVSQDYESNVPGIFIAGELGGMGLIKNSVEQGKAAVQSMIKKGFKSNDKEYDLVIIGAGPAGISASLMAKKHGLKVITLEQDTLGGTVFTFPRSKIVMTSPMDLPLFGKVKLFNTSKSELLSLWEKVISENKIVIKENTKVETIEVQDDAFTVKTNTGIDYVAKFVLLSIGRRGSPRKLNVPGEDSEKVAYRLLEPENIIGQKVLVVGGGDSAIESALALADQNEVILSYRSEHFSRIKVKNNEKIQDAILNGKINMQFNTQVKNIDKDFVLIENNQTKVQQSYKNDLVYIFAGGELPTEFLQKAGIQITKRFGYTVKKHL